MTDESRPRLPIVWMAAAMCVLVAALTVWGYRANQESQRTNQVLLDRRTADAATLVARAFSRDMRGAHSSVLFSAEWSVDMLGPPFDVQAVISRAFTDYPYPESFFAWRGEPSASSITFFDRAARRPPSRQKIDKLPTFPVEMAAAPAVGAEIARRIEPNLSADGTSSVFEIDVDGVPYQVVTRLVYQDPFQEVLAAGFGFTVNLGWARRTYFSDQVEQMRSAAGIDSLLKLSIHDEHGQRVAGTEAAGAASVTRREIPLLFADPLRIGYRPTPHLPTRQWSVEVGSVGSAQILGFAVVGARGTVILMAATAAALALGLATAARAARATAQMAELRSDFVATLTHELKTPIASIRALGDSIRSGRTTDTAEVREYATLVVEESKRLARLVDNALAYARVTDATEIYHFEAVPLAELVDEALARFSARLQQGRFEVAADVGHDLPLVRADRAALRLLLDNLIDNAIRYSDDRRSLAVAGTIAGDRVRLAVSDTGIGMTDADVGKLGRKFFRGSGGLGRSGSGLGLAIVGRITRAHGGSMDVISRLGHGTTVTIVLPVAA